MMQDITASLGEDAKRLVDNHLKIGPEKPVSYLPIKTVEKVIGITVQDYMSLIERSGNEGIVFGAEDCCINSGAVYAFNCHYLSKILKDNQTILSEHGWPAIPVDFIRELLLSGSMKKVLLCLLSGKLLEMHCFSSGVHSVQSRRGRIPSFRRPAAVEDEGCAGHQ